MVNRDEEGAVYSDHSRDERPPNQQNQQQVDLDLNATANASQESAGRNARTGEAQNSQPNSGGDTSRGQRSTSAFDRLSPGDPDPRPFGGIGSDNTQIIQDLRHRMQAMEAEVKGLRKENVELKSATKDSRSQRRSPYRRRTRSKSKSPTRRRERTPPRECTPPRERTPTRRRRHPSSSDDQESSSDDSREQRRRRPRRYKKTRGRERTPPVGGHTPFSNRILKVQLPKGFTKPTDMKYDGSTDPYVHLNDFEHQMICDGAIDEVKCLAFPVALTGLAAQCIDSHKHPINLLAVVQKPNETTRKYIERFNAECKTIDGLVDRVASLCLTNGLANDDF
ncbi:hypothetical protein PIB30_031547 [Stylosanthes scabra]|uniref:Uncharacterized protein n=1 Tax=Stylosanthes scabra TaxID=79078 RepID=A0ABU6QBH3_9FABA|nr:hypothetical protein [Stylosanthes scabra]